MQILLGLTGAVSIAMMVYLTHHMLLSLGHTSMSSIVVQRREMRNAVISSIGKKTESPSKSSTDAGTNGCKNRTDCKPFHRPDGGLLSGAEVEPHPEDSRDESFRGEVAEAPRMVV